MGEILGIGMTHYPGLIAPDEDRGFPLARALRGNTIPEEMTNPSNRPEAMRITYGEDEGVSAARAHR